MKYNPILIALQISFETLEDRQDLALQSENITSYFESLIGDPAIYDNYTAYLKFLVPRIKKTLYERSTNTFDVMRDVFNANPASPVYEAIQATHTSFLEQYKKYGENANTDASRDRYEEIIAFLEPALGDLKNDSERWNIDTMISGALHAQEIINKKPQPAVLSKGLLHFKPR